MTPTTPTPGERRWAPNSAPQETFLAYNGFEGLYGGAAGGGKSEALLVDALYGIADPSYRAVLFRRTFPELKKSLIDRARDFYPHVGGREHKTDHVWHFPSGAQIAFDSMKDPGDARKFASAEFQFVGFDELTSFLRQQYIFLLSRLRSSKGLKPRVRAATNPGGVGHEWTFERWRAWLDPREEYTGARARSGEVLYFAPDDAHPDGDGHAVPRGAPDALSRIFVRALATDNPAIDAQYLTQLKTLDRVTRAQKLGGDWLVKPGKGLYFKRDDWRYLDAPPARAAWRKAVRSWDFAATADGDWTVGTLYLHVPTAIEPYIIADVVRFRGTPGQVKAAVKATAEADGPEVDVLIPQDPGQAGVSQVDDFAALLAGFTMRSHRPTGSKVVRASPHSSQVEHHQVALVRAPWNAVFVANHQDFPEHGSPDDEIDSAADGFNYLSGRVVGDGQVERWQRELEAAGAGTPRETTSPNRWNRPPSERDDDEDDDAARGRW